MDTGLKGTMADVKDKLSTTPLKHPAKAKVLIDLVKHLDSKSTVGVFNDRALALLFRPDIKDIVSHPDKWLDGIAKSLSHYFSDMRYYRERESLSKEYEQHLGSIDASSMEALKQSIVSISKVLKPGRFESLPANIKSLPGPADITHLYTQYQSNDDDFKCLPEIVKFTGIQNMKYLPGQSKNRRKDYTGNDEMPVLTKDQIISILETYIEAAEYVKYAVTQMSMPRHFFSPGSVSQRLLKLYGIDKEKRTSIDFLMWSKFGERQTDEWVTYCSFVALNKWCTGQSSSGTKVEYEKRIFEAAYNWAVKSIEMMAGGVSVESLIKPASFKW
jgi:hypothetical protein